MWRLAPMNRSLKKQQKQKKRERRVAAKKHEAADQLLYNKKFPSFEFRTNNAPDGFVELIRRTLREIDFRDRTLFHPSETEFLTHIKRSPEVIIPALVQGIANRNFGALHLASVVGHRVFSRIPQDQLRQWIPFHDVQFLMAGEKIIVLFRSLVQSRGTFGTVYHSPNRPTVEIDGKKLIVGWSKHAIERTCERLAPRWDSYGGLGDVFAFFHECRKFDSCQLHGGRDIGITFYDKCVSGYFGGHIAKQILGRMPRNKCYHRVGYCPVVIDGPFAKATTLLYPGYVGTPEYGLILRKGMPGMTRPQIVDLASKMTRHELETNQDYSLMKMFHNNGVPQIIETDEDYYSIPSTKWN
jgi:hypothetical protein